MTRYELNRAATDKQGRQHIWQNLNGTFSHHRDSKREYTDKEGCLTDLRFADEWAK